MNLINNADVLHTFYFEDQKIRIVVRGKKVWFVLDDAKKALGINSNELNENELEITKVNLDNLKCNLIDFNSAKTNNGEHIGQMDSQKIGDAVYMLANGMGKTRANVHGVARQSQLWRIGVLSSGEKDLATHMAESNKKMYAEQGIRLLAIPAKPTPESKGLLERLNGFSNFNALANHLKDASGKYYGTPLRAFVQALLKEQNLKKSFDAALLEAKEKHLPAGADGQDYRVFDIFFTFGFAGELATCHGITGWPVGEALAAALKCFNDWLEDKGGIGNQEEKQMLAQLNLRQCCGV
jgi:uncharacterized protein (DUF927 family)